MLVLTGPFYLAVQPAALIATDGYGSIYARNVGYIGLRTINFQPACARGCWHGTNICVLTDSEARLRYDVTSSPHRVLSPCAP